MRSLFENNTTQLNHGALVELQRVAEVLNNYPRTTIETGGHTNMLWAAEYNQKLSKDRAESAKMALIQNRVLVIKW